MTKEAITLLAVGDILIDREQPETIFQHVAGVLRSGDITFANCEQMYSDRGHPSPVHASYSDPKNIPALLHAGIDLVSLANNHTLDWGIDGLLDTMARLKEAGLPYVGVGQDLAEARQPVILERDGTRVGFLAYGCIGPDGYEAEEEKPGYAPVRSWTIYEKVDYQPGTPPRIVSLPYKDDLAAMVEDIQRLKAQADVAVISFHWGQHFVPRVIPMYCFDIGHAAVDAGADLILGTHAHILKGVEVYNGKVIFYSTSNFALELGPGTLKGKSIPKVLSKFTEHYGFVPDPEYPTYPMHPEAKTTIIVKAIIRDGAIKQVSYIPCYVNKQAEPEIVARSDPRGQAVFSYMEDISRSEGLPVHFSWEGNQVLIQPKATP
jgi:poly-gamma-glutamate synthesis protein (capsule biosynthesis protein)